MKKTIPQTVDLKDKETQTIIKLKKQFKISLIVSICSFMIVALVYFIDLVFIEQISSASVSVILSIAIPAIWAMSIVPAVCLAIIGIMNKRTETAFNFGWIVGSIISDWRFGIFLAILVAPFFAVVFYINAIKTLKMKIN